MILKPYPVACLFIDIVRIELFHHPNTDGVRNIDIRLSIGLETVKMHLFSSEDASPTSSESIIPVAMIDIYFYSYFTPNCIFFSHKQLIIRTLQIRVILSPTARKTALEMPQSCFCFVFGEFLAT